jgi:hypothetical protein
MLFYHSVHSKEAKNFMFYALGLKLAEIGHYSQQLVWRIKIKVTTLSVQYSPNALNELNLDPSRLISIE